MTEIEDRKLARWRATREGALYACPHCWQGSKVPGRCSGCRRFDVRALTPRGVRLAPALGRPPLPVLAQSLEDARARARRPKRKRGRSRGDAPIA